MKDYVKISIIFGGFFVAGILAAILGARINDNIIVACGWVMIGSVFLFIGGVVNKNWKK